MRDYDLKIEPNRTLSSERARLLSVRVRDYRDGMNLEQAAMLMGKAGATEMSETRAEEKSRNCLQFVYAVGYAKPRMDPLY